MTEAVRYGVIGTGMMGVEHINNLLHLPGARITAISDPHPESRDWAQLAVGLDAPLARFESHRQLLESGLCDAVVIASPNHTHHDVLLDVLHRLTDGGQQSRADKLQPLFAQIRHMQRIADPVAPVRARVLHQP